MIRVTDFVDVLRLFRDDEQTEAVIMIGEIGGASEEMAAQYLKEEGYPKKTMAFIAGLTAPAEKKMGHAGAIVSKGLGTAESKMRHLSEAGVIVVRGLHEILQIAQ